MTARLLDCSPDDYHRRPGLSSSIATTLIAKSPLHAWAEHPAYGAVVEEESDAKLDRGSVVHTLALGAGKRFKVLDFGDWRTKAAKEAREAARADRMVPILADGFDKAEKIAAEIRRQLEARGYPLTGASEQAFEWEEDSASGPVLCRGMADHIWIERGLILDIKVAENASPAAVERTAENLGYAIQRAAYVRALERLRPELAGRIEFLFAFCEPEPPYAMNLASGDGMFRELGERRWRRAVETWGACVKAKHWPGYGSGISQISVPGWVMAREDDA